MERRFKLVLLVFIVLLSVIAVLFYIYLPVETKIVKMQVFVSNYTGFNVDTDALYFGTVPGKGTAERSFSIDNTLDIDLFVHLSTEGNISSFVSISKNDFPIKAKSSDKVKITVNIPDGIEKGEYSGELYVIFRRSIF